MQFLAVAFVGFMGVLVASFMLPGIAQSIQDFPSALNAGYPYVEINQEHNPNGLILGEAIEVKEFFFPNDNITSMLEDLPNVSRFQEFFNTAHGTALLAEPTLYTLFVPTDEAFRSLAYPQQVEVNTMTEAQVERFIQYHLVPQKIVAVDGGVKAGTIAAVSRDMLNFELRKKGGTVGNANVVATYHVENGIVYVIDGVLLPPFKGSGF